MTKIRAMILRLQDAGYGHITWDNTGGGCMVVRVPTEGIDVLVGEGGPPMGPDAFGYDDLESDEHVTGIWFASAETKDGEPLPKPVLMAGDTDDLIEAIRRYMP